MIYFTSDTHFNHDREFIYGPRGFKNITEADFTIVKNWNTIVEPNDDVYVLGDFFLGTDIAYIQDLLDILHGNIHLIRGNHDTDAKIALYRERTSIVEIADALRLDYEGYCFYLSHFPTLTANLTEHPSMVLYNLHGHTHSKKKFYQDNPYMYNVAVDAHDNKLVSIGEVMYDIDREIEKCKSFLC